MSTVNTDSYFVFKTPAMRQVYLEVDRFAPTDAPAFLMGETGTGKESIAKIIHNLSRRKDAPYVEVNCASIPSELMESHLFGSVKGAYTSSKEDILGYLREADGGTIFFDEISEMPLSAQSKLLRALQDKKFRPVGAKKDANSDFRVIASTNRSIEEILSNKILRSDLYYRISTFEVNLPPLRERPKDILPLAGFILKRLSEKYKKNFTGFEVQASNFLQHFSWPGNIRELYGCIENALTMAETKTIKMTDLKYKYQFGHILESTEGMGLLAIKERELILKTLAETKTMEEAAEILGVSRGTLYEKRKRIMEGSFGRNKERVDSKVNGVKHPDTSRLSI